MFRISSMTGLEHLRFDSAWGFSQKNWHGRHSFCEAAVVWTQGENDEEPPLRQRVARDVWKFDPLAQGQPWPCHRRVGAVPLGQLSGPLATGHARAYHGLLDEVYCIVYSV